MSEENLSHYSSENEYGQEQCIEDIDMEIEEPTTVVESQIFTEHIPVIGKIPLGIYFHFKCLVFYLPESDSTKELTKLIEKNGGRVTD